MAKVSIDNLVPERHLIDIDSHSQGDFDLADDYIIEKVFDDIILAEFIDLASDGDSVIRNGIAIPVNTLTSAWRKAKVLIVGPKVQQTKVGDIIVFPNDKGMRVSRLPIHTNNEDYTVKQGIFLNEDRIFGICKMKDEGKQATA